MLSTQVARRFVELFFGRLDARTASFRATRDLVDRHFPGDYDVIPPGADLVERPPRGEREIVDIFYSAEEERSSLRVFLRALRRLPAQLPWHATIWSRLPSDLGSVHAAARASRARDARRAGRRVGGAVPRRAPQIAVAASTGTAPAPQYVLRAMAGGAVPVVARLPEYEEALDDGERGLLFEPRDAEMLSAQLQRLIGDEELRERLHDRVKDGPRRARVEHDGRAVRGDLPARRRPPPRARTATRPWASGSRRATTSTSTCTCTPTTRTTARRRSTCCSTRRRRPASARSRSPTTTRSPARSRRRERANGIKVIVAEEVKTADQGEVIGLFIEEKIERGMSLEETIAEIRRQGGLVYVPHPFDRMHAVPDYEHMLDIVEQIDAIEVFNPRVAISSFNEEAARFAAKYRIVAGAGSDSHVAQGLGSVKIRMRDFDGPEEFLESLREADIIRRKQSLLYVQALKFIQTKGPQGRASAASSGAAKRSGPRPGEIR